MSGVFSDCAAQQTEIAAAREYIIYSSAHLKYSLQRYFKYDAACLTII